MNERQFCDRVAGEILAESAGKAFASPYTGRLSEALQALRAADVPWSQIFAAIQQILGLLSGGGTDWLAVITAILALFGKPAPTGPALP